MKNFCVIHILLFVLLMLVYQCAKAQDYVVLTSADTIRGEVKPLNFGAEKKISLVSGDKKKTVYSIFQVRGFQYKNDIFHPVKGEKGYVFMKLIKPGYLSLYAFQLENQITYDGLYFLKKDGSGLEVPNLSFKKQVATYLGDCSQVSDKVKSGELSRKAIHEIIDSYNACIADRTSTHAKVIPPKNDQAKKTTSWDTLEAKVKEQPDFQGKNDALEMISEIKLKIDRSEKIPNFLLDGLKNSLAQANVSAELEAALNELKN